MGDVPEEIRAEVKALISLLVRGDIASMHRHGLFGKSDLEVIREVLESYPGEMTMPPDSAFLDFDMYGDVKTGTFMADFPLWFDGAESDFYALIAQEEKSMKRRLYVYDLRVP
ncbi:hypothetical protein DAERI_130036 [Deinococcus aerius]|uniref:DUF7668 domain-containing protein n=1 Tax=Deinococcus aerius TaxID=200253 RepID=A0A2I9D8P4_9DEIO|nr:hypothetical protein [Deinococcus aerius]GBF07206.1 hypothetical protein DAERI_130036 [Deinococcus aerius]